MKKLLFQKFLKDNLKLLSIILMSTASIVWIIQSVNFLDIVTEDGHSIKIYAYYSLLNFPKIIHRIFPFIFFISLFYQIVQWENNNELLVFWIHGVRKIQLINTILIYSFLFGILQILLGGYISPKGQDQARSFIRNSNMDFFPSIITEGKFVDAVSGLTIFIEKKDKFGKYKNIYLKDDTQVDKAGTGAIRSQIIYAKSAVLINSNGNRFFKLFDGGLIKINSQKRTNLIKFDTINFGLLKFNTTSTTIPKIQEISSKILLKCIFYNYKNILGEFINKQFKCTTNSMKNIQQEILKRLYKPIYIPLLALISCFLILNSKESKNYPAFKFLLFLITFSVIMISEISLRFATENIFSLSFFIIFPLLSFFTLYIYLIVNFRNKP